MSDDGDDDGDDNDDDDLNKKLMWACNMLYRATSSNSFNFIVRRKYHGKQNNCHESSKFVEMCLRQWCV